MKFKELLEIVRDEPLFETGLLLAGSDDATDVRKQLSRWTNTGKLIQIRRGLYALAPPHQKTRPHPFLTANRLVPGSYVSCESALAQYGLIPEYVPVTISVSLSRPGRKVTPLGVYQFHHIRREMFYGYHGIQVGSNQQALIAAPEKALLDLIHLKKQGDRGEYLQSLRLQHMDQLNPERLSEFAEKAQSKKLTRACETLLQMIHKEKSEYRIL
ncbi:MAG TPA: hypothetical protein ENN17_05185 [bacterium]|nr:hypothetical protein [bacterium]